MFNYNDDIIFLVSQATPDPTRFPALVEGFKRLNFQNTLFYGWLVTKTPWEPFTVGIRNASSRTGMHFYPPVKPGDATLDYQIARATYFKLFQFCYCDGCDVLGTDFAAYVTKCAAVVTRQPKLVMSSASVDGITSSVGTVDIASMVPSEARDRVSQGGHWFLEAVRRMRDRLRDYLDLEGTQLATRREDFGWLQLPPTVAETRWMLNQVVDSGCPMTLQIDVDLLDKNDPRLAEVGVWRATR